MTTFAGSGTASSIDGQGIIATFYNPSGIAVDTNGNIYIGESYNADIRFITGMHIHME